MTPKKSFCHKSPSHGQIVIVVPRPNLQPPGYKWISREGMRYDIVSTLSTYLRNTLTPPHNPISHYRIGTYPVYPEEGVIRSQLV